MVAHWDGKMLLEFKGRNKVERIAIIVSYGGESKFLGAPKVVPSNGETIATTVHKFLLEWGLLGHVKAMGFDTTSVNSGDKTGACVLLQKMFNLDLLSLPCRHHIYEIILRCVFELKIGKSSAPEVLIFERFATTWKNIDRKVFRSGLEDEIVRSNILDDEITEIKFFCRQQLTKNQSRFEYEEFLQLVLIFLGDTDFTIRPPGATSHARFQAKGIYSLKIFIFRDQFTMSAVQLKGIRDVCIFIVRMYIKAWFDSTNAVASPRQDLDFAKNSIEYAQIDAELSNGVLQKISTHMWYLTPETVALAFFDPNVTVDEKKKMIQRLDSKEPVVKLLKGRTVKDPEELSLRNLSDFVSIETKLFFDRFHISREFLKLDPSTWDLNVEYQNGARICRDLMVVNDVAERGVKFMKDYNRILVTDEDQKHFLLQFVEGYRKKYASYLKSDLTRKN